jgi:asparagine synthase (glutamine-hydrolysing)
MPGISAVLSVTPLPETIAQSYTDTVLHETFFHTRFVERAPQCLLAIAYHDSYPWIAWTGEDTSTVLEGMVYNRSPEEVRTQLDEIAQRFVENTDYQSLVRKFVESSDGDFLVAILRKTDNRLLLFNDYLARLPLYYYCRDGLCIISREIKVILRFMPQITLNKSGLVEFLMFEYPLGNKTIFQDISRLDPAKMVVVEARDGQQMAISVRDSAECSFVLDSPFATRAQSIAYLRDSFLASVENRVRAIERNGHRIIADLSGGFDSRAIIGGLSRYTSQVTYFTRKYIRDESREAHEVFVQLGSPGEHIVMENDTALRAQELPALVFKTDGLVNYFTTYVCYQDLQAIKSRVPQAAVRFSGLGGEFIRHPFKLYRHSLLYGVQRLFYSNEPLDVCCRIVGKDQREYTEELAAYLDTYPESEPQERLRRLYHEYYNHRVCAAGDDRERLHFWSVSPLWGLDFARTIFARVPLRWVGFPYFVQFMKALDPRLLRAPIFGSDTRLDSPFSVWRHQARYEATTYARPLRGRIPWLYQYYRSFRGRDKKPAADNALLALLHGYDGQATLSEFLVRPVVEQALKGDLEYYAPMRILTILLYLGEIERRYGKLVSPQLATD